MTLVGSANIILGTGIVIAQVFIVAVIVYLIFFQKKYPRVQKFIAERALLLSFLVALASMAGSLFYSQIAGFAPCILCWYQRIVMYPQVVLLAIGLAKKEKKILDYTIWLSAVGAFIAAYHYLVQLGVVHAACSTVGYTVSCSKLFFIIFGYITIPVMSFTAFALLIVLWMFYKLREVGI